jgi:hypothetical protein
MGADVIIRVFEGSEGRLEEAGSAPSIGPGYRICHGHLDGD